MSPRRGCSRSRTRTTAAAVGTGFDVAPPPSNLIMVRAPGSSDAIARIVEGLRVEGVLVGAVDAHRLRAVLHAGIDDEGTEVAARAFERVLGAVAGSRP